MIDRELLARYNGERINIMGEFGRMGVRQDFADNTVDSALILSPTMADTGEPIGDRIWIKYARAFQGVRLAEGDRVRLYGLVRPHIRPHSRVTEWQVTDPDDVSRF